MTLKFWLLNNLSFILNLNILAVTAIIVNILFKSGFTFSGCTLPLTLNLISYQKLSQYIGPSDGITYYFHQLH